MPNEKDTPEKAAFAVRAYLMLRLAMHTALRQRNLRELLVCPRGRKARSLKELEELERGEIRWSDEARGWEIFIPANGFKNGRSMFFRGRPYRLVLPNLEGLYRYIDAYIERHRPFLIGGYSDPDSFFVRSSRSPSRSEPHDVTSFYDAWMIAIQKYGIYNPYTGKGAIPGLLPHGPHCVRDVIATHILKQTGSYELAGFALQDTTAAVMRHYSRFAPHEKSAMAAEVMNQVWKKPAKRGAKSLRLGYGFNEVPLAKLPRYLRGRRPSLV